MLKHIFIELTVFSLLLGHIFIKLTVCLITSNFGQFRCLIIKTYMKFDDMICMCHTIKLEQIYLDFNNYNNY